MNVDLSSLTNMVVEPFIFKGIIEHENEIHHINVILHALFSFTVVGLIIIMFVQARVWYKIKDRG